MDFSKGIASVKKDIGIAYRSDKILKPEWIVLIAISVIALLTYTYIDLKSLTGWSVNFLDMIYEGRPLDMYEYTAQNVYGLPHQFMGGEIMNILFLSVWNIPIWIAQRFYGYIAAQTPLSLLWSKLFYVICLILTCYFIYKMVIHMTGNRQKGIWGAFLVASSVFVFTGVYAVGQTDIILLLFATISVYCLLRDKQYLFLLFAAVSIAIKPFFAIPFIALVLITEKRFLYILVKLIAGSSIYLIQKLIYRGAPLYAESIGQGPGNGLIDSIFLNSFSANFGTAALFIVLLIVFYVIGYVKDTTDRRVKQSYVIYMWFATMMLYSLLIPDSFYRVVLVVPPMVVLFVNNKEYFKLNIILEVIFCAAVTYATIFIKYWDYASPHSMDLGILPDMLCSANLGYPVAVGIADAIPYNMVLVTSMVPSIIFAMGILLIIINYPKFKMKNSIDFSVCGRWIIWVRMALPVIVMMLSYYFFLAA